MSALPASGAAQPVPKIAFRGVVKRFAERNASVLAIEALDLEIPDGQFCVIVGPSGCGKTTLLRMLAGLDRPSAGEVVIRRTDPRRPSNATVFQEHSVFPWMTVADNIAYGMFRLGLDAAEQARIVAYYLDKMGLSGFARVYPHQLSGGMRQRTSIARALANDPEILLMDEPFANLDEQTRLGMQQELVRIWEENRKTVVFITHSIDEALMLGDRVVVMSARPGRISRDIALPFPRPRDTFGLRGDPRYAALGREIWELLRDDHGPRKASV